MFRCAKCNRITKPKEKMFKVPIAKRSKMYIWKKNTTFGWEIEEEAAYCFNCYRQYLEKQKQEKLEQETRKLQRHYK